MAVFVDTGGLRDRLSALDREIKALIADIDAAEAEPNDRVAMPGANDVPLSNAPRSATVTAVDDPNASNTAGADAVKGASDASKAADAKSAADKPK